MGIAATGFTIAAYSFVMARSWFCPNNDFEIRADLGIYGGLVLLCMSLVGSRLIWLAAAMVTLLALLATRPSQIIMEHARSMAESRYSEQSPAVRDICKFHGSIRDASGKPLQGVTVWLAGDACDPSISDINGGFYFEKCNENAIYHLEKPRGSVVLSASTERTTCRVEELISPPKATDIIVSMSDDKKCFTTSSPASVTPGIGFPLLKDAGIAQDDAGATSPRDAGSNQPSDASCEIPIKEINAKIGRTAIESPSIWESLGIERCPNLSGAKHLKLEVLGEIDCSLLRWEDKRVWQRMKTRRWPMGYCRNREWCDFYGAYEYGWYIFRDDPERAEGRFWPRVGFHGDRFEINGPARVMKFFSRDISRDMVYASCNLSEGAILSVEGIPWETP